MKSEELIERLEDYKSRHVDMVMILDAMIKALKRDGIQ